MKNPDSQQVGFHGLGAKVSDSVQGGTYSNHLKEIKC